MTQEAVELLMKKSQSYIENATEKRDRKIDDAKKEFSAAQLKAKSLKESAQEICDHPESYKVDDFDHHRGEGWTIDYCKACDKYLRRH